MSCTHLRPALLALAGLGACLPALADEAEPMTFFVGQRFWSSSLETKLMGASLGLQSPTNPQPVVRTSLVSQVSSGLASITSAGVRMGNFTVQASVMPSVSVAAGSGAAGGRIKRSEYDLSIGYAIAPAVTASLVYKSARFSPIAAQSARDLLGVEGSETAKGLLLGLGASGPLNERLSLYGSLAYGPSRWTVNGTAAAGFRTPGRYLVNEIGMAYRLVGPDSIAGVNAISVQLGYRTQVADIHDIELQTLSLGTPPAVIATDRAKVRSTVQGLVMALNAAF